MPKSCVICLLLVQDQATVQAKKEDLLQEIFNFLAMSLGLPPRKFDFAYRDKDDNYQSEKGITPQEFYKKYVNLPLEDYVSVINAPTADKPYGKSTQLRCWGMWLVAVQFATSTFQWSAWKNWLIAQMQTGETVWFGSDVGQLSNRKAGILATDVYDFWVKHGHSTHSR